MAAATAYVEKYPEASGEQPEEPDWLDAANKAIPQQCIQYKQQLAGILFDGDYKEAKLLEDGMTLISPRDSDADVETMAYHIQQMSEACGQTPNEKLSHLI